MSLDVRLQNSWHAWTQIIDHLWRWIDPQTCLYMWSSSRALFPKDSKQPEVCPVKTTLSTSQAQNRQLLKIPSKSWTRDVRSCDLLLFLCPSPLHIKKGTNTISLPLWDWCIQFETQSTLLYFTAYPAKWRPNPFQTLFREFIPTPKTLIRFTIWVYQQQYIAKWL